METEVHASARSGMGRLAWAALGQACGFIGPAGFRALAASAGLCQRYPAPLGPARPIRERYFKGGYPGKVPNPSVAHRPCEQVSQPLLWVQEAREVALMAEAALVAAGSRQRPLPASRPLLLTSAPTPGPPLWTSLPAPHVPALAQQHRPGKPRPCHLPLVLGGICLRHR